MQLLRNNIHDATISTTTPFFYRLTIVNLKTKTDEKTPVLLYHAYYRDKRSSLLQNSKCRQLSKQDSRTTTNPASPVTQVNTEGN